MATKNIPLRNPGLRPKEAGTQPVMNGGKGSAGVTNESLKKLGRNLAKVANQGK